MMVGQSKTNRQGGFTLIEVVMVCAVMGIILLTVITFSLSVQKSYETCLDGARVTANVRKPLETLSDELRNCSMDEIIIETDDPHADCLIIRVPVGYNSGSIIWGADGQAGYSIEYSVINNELVRFLLNEEEDPVDRRVLARNVDVLRDGVKGFGVSRVGNLCTLSLRIRVSKTENRRIQRQAVTSVTLRN